jgi:hypothetical protein
MTKTCRLIRGELPMKNNVFYICSGVYIAVGLSIFFVFYEHVYNDNYFVMSEEKKICGIHVT